MPAPRCDWCDKPDPDLVYHGGARYHEACFIRRAGVLHECDDAATVRRLKGQLLEVEEARDDLARRLAYAEEQIRHLRGKLNATPLQAAAPSEPHG